LSLPYWLLVLLLLILVSLLPGATAKPASAELKVGIHCHCKRFNTATSLSRRLLSLSPKATRLWLPTTTAVCPLRPAGNVPPMDGLDHIIMLVSNTHTSL